MSEAPANCIRIRNWNAIYETASTRKRERLAWIQLPTGIDSPETVALLGGAWHESGMQLADGRQVDGISPGERQQIGVMALGVIHAMIAHQGTCRKARRGSFVRDDGSAMSSAMVAAVLRVPLQLLENALVALSSPLVAWVEMPGACQSSATDLPLFCQSPADKEKEKEKEKEVSSSSSREGGRLAGEWQESGRSGARPLSAEEESTVEAIRHAYPRLTRPLETQAAIWARIQAGADPEAMLAGTQAIAALVDAEWTEADRLRKLPNPVEFFGGDRWREDPREWRNAKTVEAETVGGAAGRAAWGDFAGGAPASATAGAAGKGGSA